MIGNATFYSNNATELCFQKHALTTWSKHHQITGIPNLLFPYLPRNKILSTDQLPHYYNEDFSVSRKNRGLKRIFLTEISNSDSALPPTIRGFYCNTQDFHLPTQYIAQVILKKMLVTSLVAELSKHSATGEKTKFKHAKRNISSDQQRTIGALQ